MPAVQYETATTQYQYVPDFPARAESRPIKVWDKPKIRAYLRSLGSAAQVHEDDAFGLVASTGIYEAVGAQLDQWGELVGEKRGPLLDEDYRRFILGRVLVNHCGGGTDALLEVFEIITQPNAGTFHVSNFPASAYLMVERLEFMSEPVRRRVARMMYDAFPAARALVMIEALVDGFGWDEEGSEAFDVGPFSRLIELE